MKETKQYEMWETHGLKSLEIVFPDPDYERWKECRLLFPHAALMLKSKTKGPDALLSLASILHKAAWFAREQGSYDDAEVMARRSVEAIKSVRGKEHSDTLSIMANLASTYWHQGRSKEAEELNDRVMEARKRVLGEEHPDTLNSMNNLASTFWNQGRWSEAEELEVEVMETRKRVLGKSIMTR